MSATIYADQSAKFSGPLIFSLSSANLTKQPNLVKSRVLNVAEHQILQ